MKKEVIINLSKIVKDYDNDKIDLNYIFKDVMYKNGATKESEGRIFGFSLYCKISGLDENTIANIVTEEYKKYFPKFVFNKKYFANYRAKNWKNYDYIID